MFSIGLLIRSAFYEFYIDIPNYMRLLSERIVNLDFKTDKDLLNELKDIKYINKLDQLIHHGI